MLKHYIRLAGRHLAKQKLLTGINIIGLSLGLACCILLILYGVNELNYDNWHVHAARLYRVNEVFSRDEVKHGEAGLYTPLGPTLKKEFPDVENFARITMDNREIVRVKDQLMPTSVAYADPQVFSLFTFPLLRGNPEAALKDPNSVVITREKALQLFGSLDVLGRTLEIKKDTLYEPFVVSAVAENIPENSTIRWDMLGSYDYMLAHDRKESINNWHMTFGDQTFVLLRPGSDLARQPKKMLAFREKYDPLDPAQKKKMKGPPPGFELQPVKNMHTDTEIEFGPPGTTTDPKNVWILLAIAGGIVLIASINFTTLAIARSAGRAREVGVRKVIGGRRGQLIYQFLTESLFLTTLSALLGLALAYILLPWFNDLSGKTLTLSFHRWPQLAWMFAGLVLLVGLAAGSYPALVLSGFNAVAVLKNKIRLGGENFFTKSLVTLQFIVSIGLVIATMVILRQVSYMRSKDLGLIKENTVVINMDDVDGGKMYPFLRRALGARPEVMSIAASQIGLGEGQGFMGGGYEFGPDKKDGVIEYPVDSSFLNVMGMRLLAGRNFSSSMSLDTAGAVIVNETLVKNDLGVSPDKAIGVQFKSSFGEGTKTIIGVVKDFNFEKLTRKVRAQLFFMPPDFRPSRIFVHLRAGDPTPALSAIQAAWKSAVPELTLRYSFLDEDLDRYYKAEARWRDIIGCAGGISIFLACLGLFGLAALTAINRVKEIGVRKVLGASTTEIMRLLISGFLKLVLLASLIASPLAWYFTHKWLEQFAYRIELGWMVFAVTALVAVCIATLTIGVQAFRAASTNPVNNLRSE